MCNEFSVRCDYFGAPLQQTHNFMNVERNLADAVVVHANDDTRDALGLWRGKGASIVAKVRTKILEDPIRVLHLSSR